MKKAFRLSAIVSTLSAMILVFAASPGHCGDTEQQPSLTPGTSMEQPAGPEATSADPLTRAGTLYNEGKYDEVIRLLNGPASSNPGNFPLNVLLAKAQVEKCEDLKAMGDTSYKSLVMDPYATAKRLNRIDPYRPEPYYVAGKCLLINRRPTRAVRSIKKALYFAPDTPEYLAALGDGCTQMGDRDPDSLGRDRYFSLAREAYQKAAAGTDNERLRAEVEIKMKDLQKKIDDMGGTLYRN